MQPSIYLDGPGAPLLGEVERSAVQALQHALVDHFGGLFTLQRAYLDFLAADQDDVEALGHPNGAPPRQPTPFERAFDELAPQVHERLQLPVGTRFAVELF